MADVQSFRIIKKHHEPDATDVLVVMVVYNESLRLPDTLRHYRELGIQRFAVIDNNSTDTTHAFLRAQRDVDLYWTDLDFRNSSGCGWVSALVHTHYGSDRWIIYSDADEQLVFDRYQERRISQLCRVLTLQGRKSLPCLMLEMYANTSLESTVLLDQQRLIDRCPWFDGTGYQRLVSWPLDRPVRTRWSGGPSERVFKIERGWQGKTPLVYWDGETWYWNPHVVYPFHLNVSEPTGILMHFKYLSDFYSYVNQAVERRQHAENAKKYRTVQDVLLDRGGASLWTSDSLYLKNSNILVHTKLMTPIDWHLIETLNE